MLHILCEIIVIGAGLAGLAAADHLKTEGYNVIIVEAGDRVGGRVLTRHFPDGTHLEEGAFSFGNKEQPLFDTVTRFGLTKVPHTQMERPFWFQGHEGTLNGTGEFLSGIEREIPLSQMMNHFRCKLEKITEDISAIDALRSIGASPEAIKWLEANTLPGLLGSGFETISTQTLLNFLKQYDGSTAFYALKGGNDQLPKAYAEQLKENILLNHRVNAIEKLKDQWLLKGSRSDGETFTIEAKKVVFAIPTPELKKIMIDPKLSEKKQRAIENTLYTRCARISAVAPPGIFGTPRGGVFLFSDQLGWFREQSAFQQDPFKKTVINVSVVGEQAEKASQMTFEEWKKSIDDALTSLSPNWDPEQVEYYTHFWEEGYSYFAENPQDLQASLREPENGLYFAGEHTSHQFSSMNGAIQSGLRAAKEVQTP